MSIAELKRLRASPVAKAPSAQAAGRAGQKAQRAKGRLSPGEMNKLEAAYDAHLEERQRAGEIVWRKFEGIKLRLADNTFLTVDFAVMRADCTLEMHEVKGGIWEDDARVKMKVAASLYPFVFVAAQRVPRKDGGGWKWETFG